MILQVKENKYNSRDSAGGRRDLFAAGRTHIIRLIVLINIINHFQPDPPSDPNRASPGYTESTMRNLPSMPRKDSLVRRVYCEGPENSFL